MKSNNRFLLKPFGYEIMAIFITHDQHSRVLELQLYIYLIHTCINNLQLFCDSNILEMPITRPYQ